MTLTAPFSRLLAAFGLAIALHLTMADWVRLSSGPGAAADYLVAALLVLPILEVYLGLVRRARAERAHAYAIARAGFSPRRAFGVGWLLLGSAIGAAAALLATAAELASPILNPLYALDARPGAVAVLLALLLALDQESDRVPDLRMRLRVTVACLIALGAFLLDLARLPAPSLPEALPVAAASPLRATALMALVVWALVLSVDPARPGARAGSERAFALLAWVVPALAMAGVALLWGRLGPPAPGSEWLFDALPAASRLALLARAAAVILCVIAASQLARAARQIAVAMCADRMLFGEGQGAAQTATLLVPVAIAVLPRHLLAGLASGALLWSAGLLLWRPRAAPAPRRPGIGYAVLQGVASVTSILLPMLLPRAAFDVVAAWSLAGVAFWLAWAAARARLGTSGETDPPIDDEVAASATAGTLLALDTDVDAKGGAGAIRFAMRLASRDGRGLHVLRYLSPDALDDEEGRPAVDRATAQLESLGRLAGDAGGVRPSFSARVSASKERSVREAAGDCGAACLLLAPGPDPEEPWVERVLVGTRLPAVVLPGSLETPKRRVVLALGSGPFSRAALPYAEALADAVEGELIVATACGPTLPEERAEERLEEMKARARRPVVTRLLRDASALDALAPLAEGGILVLGATLDPLFRLPLRGGLADAWRDRGGTAVVVKGEETERGRWLRHLWHTLAAPFPQLAVGERASVAAAMRRASTASLDFYVLLSLAAAIASLGLVLNSAATIIGAMLVAPLMSPILAFAHGLVVGSDALMRRSLSSIALGAVGAILMGVLVAVALPDRLPSSEMLARGQPSLLDLMVAIASGAAAAYAVCNRSVAGALPGVAISVALVPPLCVVGWGLGSDELALAGGALLLFLTNLAGIVLFGALVFGLVGVRPARRQSRGSARSALTWTVAALLAISIPLSLQSQAQVQALRIERLATLALARRARGERIHELSVARSGGRPEIELVLLAGPDAGEDAVEAIRLEIERELGVAVRVHARILSTLTVESGEEPAPR